MLKGIVPCTTVEVVTSVATASSTSNAISRAAIVQSIQYDPYRTAFIALVEYNDSEKRYILAPEGLQVGQKFNRVQV